MSDTSEATRAQLAALYASRSAGDRLRMATSLFATAKRLATAGIRRDAADLDERGVRSMLLLRLHGDVLSEAEQAAVIRSLDVTPRS
jgi:hypothetical protein